MVFCQLLLQQKFSRLFWYILWIDEQLSSLIFSWLKYFSFIVFNIRQSLKLKENELKEIRKGKSSFGKLPIYCFILDQNELEVNQCNIYYTGSFGTQNGECGPLSSLFRWPEASHDIWFSQGPSMWNYVFEITFETSV